LCYDPLRFILRFVVCHPSLYLTCFCYWGSRFGFAILLLAYALLRFAADGFGLVVSSGQGAVRWFCGFGFVALSFMDLGLVALGCVVLGWWLWALVLGCAVWGFGWVALGFAVVGFVVLGFEILGWWLRVVILECAVCGFGFCGFGFCGFGLVAWGCDFGLCGL